MGEWPIGADVFRAQGEGLRAAILMIHGGALIMGSRESINRSQVALFLQAGYTVISIDYRLAPETKLPGIIEDLRDSYTWVHREGREKFGIDPARIAVIGYSAGGYLTLMSGISVKPRPAAIVAFYGYGDIVGEWYSKPDPFYSRQPAVPKEKAYGAVGETVISGSAFDTRFPFYLFCRQQGLWPKEVGGHDPVSEKEWFRQYCPVQNVTAEYPPTMLLHGDRDTDVPYEQSAMMAKELELHGVDNEFITMPGRGHGFDGSGKGLQDQEIKEAFGRILNFLAKHFDSK